jgi:hypothetical protein
MPHASPAVVLDRVTFTWPDGTVALDTSPEPSAMCAPDSSDATAPASPRCSASSRAPASRHPAPSRSGTVDVMPQRVPEDTRVAALLGVDTSLDAVRAIASGDVDQRHFDAVGDDWDVEARARPLAEAGLPADALDRRVGALSGGEAVLAALVGVRLRGARSRCWTSRPTTSTATRGRASTSSCAAGAARSSS